MTTLDTSTMPHTHINLLQEQAALFYEDAVLQRLNAIDAKGVGHRAVFAHRANISAANAASISAFVRRTMGIE